MMGGWRGGGARRDRQGRGRAGLGYLCFQVMSSIHKYLQSFINNIKKCMILPSI